MKINTRIKFIVRGALIAALYAVLTILLEPISYGVIQCRISEALTLLPFYIPEAIPGLLVGCVIANFYGGFGIADIVFGSAATLLAAVCTSKFSKNIYIAAFYPVIFNALIIGTMLNLLTNAPLLATIFYVGLGEVAACYIIGIPLMKILDSREILK